MSRLGWESNVHAGITREGVFGPMPGIARICALTPTRRYPQSKILHKSLQGLTLFRG